MVRYVPTRKHKELSEGISGSKTDILIARRIIQLYKNDSSTSPTNSITEETLSKYGLSNPVL